MMKHKISYLILGLAILTTSCMGVVLNRQTVESGSIPPGFGKKGTVLLCHLTESSNRDKYMKKYVSKNYNGEVEFVTSADMQTSKYEDVNKYRYFFSCTKYKNVFISTGKTHTYTSVYSIYDRLEEKKYEGTSSSSYAVLINAYTINMEKTRVENQ